MPSIPNTFPYMVKKNQTTAQKLRSLPIYYGLVVLVSVFFVSGFGASSLLQKIQSAFGLAASAFTSAQEAQDQLKKQDIAAAHANLGQAAEDFAHAHQELVDSSAAVEILSAIPTVKNTTNLLKAGELAADGGEDLLEVYNLLKDVALTSQGIVAQSTPAELVRKISEKNSDALDKISQAESLFAKVNKSIIPNQYRELFEKTHNQFIGIKSVLSVSSDALEAMSPLLTGKRTILLLLENDTELRPTGGFIGTYGLLTLEDGVLNDVKITSIYDTDGQLTEKISPPWPLLLVNGFWSLRDSNWFIDFSQSGQMASVFFEKQGNATPDVVIAVTPRVFESILSVTGPLDMPKYQTVLSADTLIKTIQHETSVNYDKEINQPKQLLADAFPVLLQKILSAQGDSANALLKVVIENFSQKNILIYSRLKPLQTFAESYNWAGRVVGSHRDYLAVNTANLNGTKSDRNQKDAYTLDSTIYLDGVTNTFRLTRTNTQTPDQPTTTSLSFIRILVPENAILTSAHGFSQKNKPAEPKNNSFLPQAVVWNKNQFFDHKNGVVVGKESGKTYFGGFLELPPGKTKTITLTYTIPVVLASLDNWSLVVQKQPGVMNKQFQYSLSFPDRKLLWNTTGAEETTSSSIHLGGDIGSDKFFGFVLKQRDF